MALDEGSGDHLACAFRGGDIMNGHGISCG